MSTHSHGDDRSTKSCSTFLSGRRIQAGDRLMTQDTQPRCRFLSVALLLWMLPVAGRAAVGDVNNVAVNDFLQGPTSGTAARLRNDGILTSEAGTGRSFVGYAAAADDFFLNAGIADGQVFDGNTTDLDILVNEGILNVGPGLDAVVGISDVQNSGEIIGNVNGGRIFTNSGTVGDVTLGFGGIVIGNDSTFIQTAGSAGTVTMATNRFGTIRVEGGFVSSIVAANPTATFTITGGTVDDYRMAASGGVTTVNGGRVTSLVGGTVNNDVITITGGSVGLLNLGDGRNVLTLRGGEVERYAAGAGTDTLNMKGGSIGLITDSTIGGGLIPGQAEASEIEVGPGAVVGTARDLPAIQVTGDGTSSLRVDGTVLGTITYGALGVTANETITIGGTVFGTLSTFGGEDLITVSGTIGSPTDTTGVTVTAINTGAEADSVLATLSSQIQGDVVLGMGNDRYTGSGSIEGNLLAGLGDDHLTLNAGSLFGFHGSDGDDTVDLRLDTVTFVNLLATVGFGGANTGVGDTLNLSTASDTFLTEARFAEFEILNLAADLDSRIVIQGDQAAATSITFLRGIAELRNDDFLDSTFTRQAELGGLDSVRSALLTVNSGARLEGNGLLEATGGAAEVRIDGILSPGTAQTRIGQISVMGNYVQNADGDLIFDVQGPGTIAGAVASSKTQDLVRIAGSATLNGGDLKVRTNGDTLRALTRWTVFDTRDGVTGTLNAEVLDADNLRAETRVNGLDLELILRRTDLDFASSVSEDPFVGRYGPILNDALASETADLIPFLNELSLLGPGERGALIRSAFSENPLIQIGQFTSTVSRRLDMARSQSAGTPDKAAGPGTAAARRDQDLRVAAERLLSPGGPMPALASTLMSGFTQPLPQGAAQRVRTSVTARQKRKEKQKVEEEQSEAPTDEAGEEESDPDKGVWVQVFGTRSEREFETPFNLQGSGVTLGFDHAVNDQLTLGVFGGKSDSRGKQGQAGTQTQDIDTMNFGGYASYTRGHTYLDVVYDSGDYDIASRRLIAAGALTFSSAADYGAVDRSLFVEGGWLYEPTDLLFMQPLVTLQRRTFDQDGIVETGGVAGTLTYDPIWFSTLQSSFGARIFRVLLSEDGTLFLPEVKARWLHNFDHEGILMRQTIASTGSIVQFRTEDLADENVAQIQVGMSAFATSNVEFNMNYFGEFGQNSEIHSGTATVAYRFD